MSFINADQPLTHSSEVTSPTHPLQWGYITHSPTAVRLHHPLTHCSAVTSQHQVIRIFARNAPDSWLVSQAILSVIFSPTIVRCPLPSPRPLLHWGVRSSLIAHFFTEVSAQLYWPTSSLRCPLHSSGPLLHWGVRSSLLAHDFTESSLPDVRWGLRSQYFTEVSAPLTSSRTVRSPLLSPHPLLWDLRFPLSSHYSEVCAPLYWRTTVRSLLSLVINSCEVSDPLSSPTTVISSLCSPTTVRSPLLSPLHPLLIGLLSSPLSICYCEVCSPLTSPPTTVRSPLLSTLHPLLRGLLSAPHNCEVSSPLTHYCEVSPILLAMQ